MLRNNLNLSHAKLVLSKFWFSLYLPISTSHSPYFSLRLCLRKLFWEPWNLNLRPKCTSLSVPGPETGLGGLPTEGQSFRSQLRNSSGTLQGPVFTQPCTKLWAGGHSPSPVVSGYPKPFNCSKEGQCLAAPGPGFQEAQPDPFFLFQLSNQLYHFPSSRQTSQRFSIISITHNSLGTEGNLVPSGAGTW